MRQTWPHLFIGRRLLNHFYEEFGVFVKKSKHGKTYMGIQRASFIIDSDGKIAAIWPKAKVAGHAADVLER